MINLESKDVLGFVAALDPATINSTAKFSDVVDTRIHPALLCVFQLGDMSNEAIFLVVERCDSDGGNPATVKSIALSASASANDNTQHVIYLEAADLVGQTQRHVRLKMVTDNTTGGPGAGLILSTSPRYQPASQYNVASVANLRT